MGKWDVDFDDYEERSGYNGEPPKPGLYEAKLVSLEEHTTSDTSLHWIFEIDEDGSDYVGWQGHIYSDLANAKWKTQQIVKALQGGVEKKLNIDPDKSAALIKKASRVQVRVKSDTYEGEYRPKISVVLPLGDVSSSKGGGGKKGKGKKDPWQDDED